MRPDLTQSQAAKGEDAADQIEALLRADNTCAKFMETLHRTPAAPALKVNPVLIDPTRRIYFRSSLLKQADSSSTTRKRDLLDQAKSESARKRRKRMSSLPW